MGDAVARRILFKGKTAVGVEIERSGKVSAVDGKEIIVSCGVFGSPKLLMLSGIGSSKEMQSLGITVLQDVAGVGKHMKEHPMNRILLCPKPGVQLDPIAPRVGIHHTAKGSPLRNDIRLQLHSGPLALAPGQPPETHLFVNCLLEAPYGTGEVRLTSADPQAQPQIDFRFLEDKRDLERMRQLVRFALWLLQHKAFAQVVQNRVVPGDAALASDEALDTWLLENVTTGMHATSTCRMGPSSDAMAVVDQRCRLYGFEGLRVADASVMPDIIRANTNCTTIMIAERLADWIKER